MTLKSLTILDLDLVDSNEAILVLNNLPNVQILNGKNTNDDEEEEYDDDNNENIKTRNQLEEIEEDKNVENNSNYISSDNNLLNNDYTPRIDGIHDNSINNNINKSYKEKSINKHTDEIQNNKNDDEGHNTPLYDRIISADSNKKIIANFDSDKKSEENIENKFYYFNNYMIDITNEELNLINEDKNNFLTFLQQFNEIFPKNKEKAIINIYNDKIKDIENKKGNIPNYYYFYLIIKKKISILKNLFDEIFPFILNNCPELNKNDIFIKLYTEIIKIITSSKQLMLSLHKHIELYNNKSSIENQNETNYNNELNNLIIKKNEMMSKMASEKSNLLKQIDEDKKRYELKIKKLEKENEVMTNKLIKNMNLTIRTSYSELNSGKKKMHLNNAIIKEENYKSKTPREINVENSKNNKSPERTNLTTLSAENNLNLHTFNPSSKTSKHQPLSLKALKEFINELYIYIKI